MQTSPALTLMLIAKFLNASQLWSLKQNHSSLRSSAFFGISIYSMLLVTLQALRTLHHHFLKMHCLADAVCVHSVYCFDWWRVALWLCASGSSYCITAFAVDPHCIPNNRVVCFCTMYKCNSKYSIGSSVFLLLYSWYNPREPWSGKASCSSQSDSLFKLSKTMTQLLSCY